MQTVVLTKELIDRCRTNGGAFSGDTIRAFGLDRKTMTPGWPVRLVGKTITQEQYLNAFLGRLLLKKTRVRQGHPELFDIKEMTK